MLTKLKKLLLATQAALSKPPAENDGIDNSITNHVQMATLTLKNEMTMET